MMEMNTPAEENIETIIVALLKWLIVVQQTK
jgi:hypothetical protein